MTHPAIASWPRGDDGALTVGGWPVPRLAAALGRTPFFAYDRDRITRRVRDLRAVLPAGLRLHYAIKANPMPAVIQHLAGLVDGFDVASAGELTEALATGAAPGDIGFAGPGKTDAELARAAAAGVVIELESEGELHRLATLARARGLTPPVALRVNPDFRIKGSGMQMGGGPSAFGLDAEAAPALLAELRETPLRFVGFHIFAGSQTLDAAAVGAATGQIAELAITLAEHAPAPVRHLNIGGGFGIPYFPKDRPLDLSAVGRDLCAVAGRLGAALPEARVIVELGRYLVGEAGLYVCRVVDRKVSRGQVYLVTDGGLHHHLAATGNFGQGLRRNFPVALAERPEAAPEETVQVVGCLCTPLDLLADKLPLARAAPGDLVAVFQSGAYAYTASPRDFLGHPHPPQVLLGAGASPGGDFSQA